MTTLFVAAGGGGDALAAAILHIAAGPQAGPALIATYAWDRLLVDPLPGPRGVGSFTGLDQVGSRTWAVTGTSRPIAPAGSTLPRLAAELQATLVLLDPYEGGLGLAAQLRDAVSVLAPDRVEIVDVGGDVLARGDEPELKSPLADALVLAACADLPVPTGVLVAGLGLDGELPVGYAQHRLLAAGGGVDTVLKPEHVAPVASVFNWHPSEATGMLAAAIGGARGVVEVRDAGTQIALDDSTAEVWRCDYQDLATASLLVPGLRSTSSLAEVEQVVRSVCGFCELDYERVKASKMSAAGPRPLVDLEAIEDRVAAFDAATAGRGADFVTFRRLAEAVGVSPGGYETLRARLIQRHPHRYIAPLWSVIEPDSNGGHNGQRTPQ